MSKLLGLTLAAGGLLAQTVAGQITIDLVMVGNAGNAADPNTGFGAVGYTYGIGKYEVTLNQYTAFLNAVGATDTYGLYNASMAASGYIAQIEVSGSYTYSVIGSGARPVSYVSWYDSARFVNWLQNGQPTGLQVAGTTETGAYTLTGNTGIILRNAGWVYGLPSDDEWYKAAYHQPAGQGGDVDNYWTYPTANNATPHFSLPNNTDPNSANYFFAVGDVTDVGAYSVADSFYGTFDQGGNVREWDDAVSGGSRRGLRGGAWNDSSMGLFAPFRASGVPAMESDSTGFRVATVPEPSVIGLMALGIIALAWKRK